MQIKWESCGEGRCEVRLFYLLVKKINIAYLRRFLAPFRCLSFDWYFLYSRSCDNGSNK